MMGLMKFVFGVAVVPLLACRVNAQTKSAAAFFLPRHPIPQAPFDKCQVEEGEKIKCGTPETTAEQCLKINCCFDRQQCWKAGCCSSAGTLTRLRRLVMELGMVNDVPAPQSVAAPGPLRVELRLANGQCITKGCVEEKAAYTSYYTTNEYPITKYLKEPLYVEVRMLDRTDSNLHLMLEHCWATHTPNPDSLPQWELISEGCPYNDDHHMTTLVPICPTTSGLLYPNHYKRFIVKMFAFVDEHSFVPQQTSVFIHCTTAVCHPSSTVSCDWPCPRQRRAARSVKDRSGKKFCVSSDRVILLAAQNLTGNHTTSVNGSSIKR